MGVMQIIGRADADEINALVLPAELVKMPVEPFKLSKKVCLGEIGVHDSHCIGPVQCCNHFIASITDCLQMPGGYVSSYANYSKSLHLALVTDFPINKYFS